MIARIGLILVKLVVHSLHELCVTVNLIRALSWVNVRSSTYRRGSLLTVPSVRLV